MHVYIKSHACSPHTQNADAHIHVYYVSRNKSLIKVEVNVMFVNAVCMLNLKHSHYAGP